MPELHSYYRSHVPAMEEAMRQRLELAEPWLKESLGLADVGSVKREIMEEFAIVLRQMPYVGGAENRMSDFFMRLLGFMAIGRVLKRRGVSDDLIQEIELESFKRHLLTIPEAERMEAGRQFMSDDNRQLIRRQAEQSHQKVYPGDFVYDFVEPVPGDTFEFGVNYRSCGFCQFAARHGDRDILPSICGLDFAA